MKHHDHPLTPPPVVDTACLTPASGDGEVVSCLEESPIQLAQRPKEIVAVDSSPCNTGIVATVRACSQSSCDSVTAQVEQPTPPEQSPMRRKCPAIAPPGIATPPRKCAKTEPSTKTGPVDCDAPLASVRQKPIKASVNRDLPTIRSLKLRLLPDQFVAGACFFYSVAQTLHALGSDTPLPDTLLWAKAIAVYREMCGTQHNTTQHNITQHKHNTTRNLRLLVLPWGGQRGGGVIFRLRVGPVLTQHRRGRGCIFHLS